MPIKGLSDQVRLPRLGKIRLGIKVEGVKNPYPQPVDYFVCPDPVKKIFGDKPRELRTLFPTEDSTRWASQFYRCYSKSRGLICKGGGERAPATKKKNKVVEQASIVEHYKLPNTPQSNNGDYKPQSSLGVIHPGRSV